jgi:hypothetical protein
MVKIFYCNVSSWGLQKMDSKKRWEFSVGWRVVLCVLLYLIAVNTPKLAQQAREYLDMTDREKWQAAG